MRTLRIATRANANRAAEACAAAGYLVQIQNTGRHYLLIVHRLAN